MESNLKRSSDRFESWKEIAAYLDRTERTARRWEKSEGLPIHRHPHAQRDSVYAFKAELDQWFDGRGKHPEQTSSAATPLSIHWLRLTIAASAAVLTALAGVVWMAVANGPSAITRGKFFMRSHFCGELCRVGPGRRPRRPTASWTMVGCGQANPLVGASSVAKSLEIQTLV